MVTTKDYFKYIGGVIAITLAALLIYQYILFPPLGGQLYPWASDTQGHMLKVEYLAANLRQGISYPKIFPDWYMGMQFMRYYPPLPYYILVALSFLLPQPASAANWFIMLCALAGGLSWLLYRRWIGLVPAVVGGILFLILPDNVRVALAEGNMPRVLAAALLPVTIYLLLRSLEESGSIWHRIGLAICFALIVLSHAMMAAIYAVCGALLVIFIWIRRTATLKKAVHTISFIVLGMLLSAWWLVPSFSGGITELNTSAMTEALAVFPITNYLDPTQRIGDPEAVYIGMALLALSVASLWVFKEQQGYTTALTYTGCLGVLITTTGINPIFNALPLHNLLWPLRFLGIASFALLLALMWSLRGWKKISPLVALAVVGVLALDFAGSLFLIRLRPVDPDVSQVSQRLSLTEGWREATLDLSKLGSAPSFSFSSIGDREQLFGWAYQGARTAKTVAALNDAIEMNFPVYLLDRLDLYGTDDVVLLKELPGAGRIADGLLGAGYLNIYSGQRVDHFHRDGGPRAFIAGWEALGIGRGAQNLAYLFPWLIVGTSPRVDDYSLEQLLTYKTVVLSGFDWHDRERAEALVEGAARQGVNIVVDLTGVKQDPWARIPRFLEVWGEQVILSPQPVKVTGIGQEYTLEAFSHNSHLWYTHMLQGLEQEFWSFEYLEEKGTMVGYNSYGKGKVWFMGLNIPYHAVQSHDPLVIQLLSVLLQLEPHRKSDYVEIPLYGYTANHDGYRFAYQLDEGQTLFVPIAHQEGIYVLVDGEPVKEYSLEHLLAFEAPAGEHSVQVGVRTTPGYQIGNLLSGSAFLGLFAIILFRKRIDILK